MTKDDIVEDRLGDAERVEHLGIDVSTLGADLPGLAVRPLGGDCRIQRLDADVFQLLRSFHRPTKVIRSDFLSSISIARDYAENGDGSSLSIGA